MRLVRLAVAGCLVAFLSSCEKSTYVHGTVFGSTPHGPKPVRGATIASHARGQVSTSAADGSYDISPKASCWYLPHCYAANPQIEFSAPGYRPRVVRLRSEAPERGVTRVEYVPATEIGLDVVLEPLAPAAP